jgi:hypothetical protein
MVYVVVVVGLTEILPPLVGDTVPTPLFMLQEEAFEEVHVRSVLLPDAIDAGETVSVADSAGADDPTVTVCCASTHG